MPVVSFKVSKELKEKMDRFGDRVNWGEELRKFVKSKIRELEAEENLRVVVEELKRCRWSTPIGFAASLVREDRGSS